MAWAESPRVTLGEHEASSYPLGVLGPGRANGQPMLGEQGSWAGEKGKELGERVRSPV